MSASGRSSRLLVLLSTLVALLGAGLVASPAQAAPAAPRGLTPSGQLMNGTPILSWGRVPGATSYDVQLDTSPDFASPLYRTTTTNDTVTPNVELPPGEIWWQVQANSAAGDSEPSTTSFQRDRLGGPLLLSPADGAVRQQPRQPALLEWQPVRGAVSYTIEIDDAEDFIGATTLTTKTSSYVVPNPQVATTYYWHVRATLANGVVTNYSDDWTYSIGGLAKPVLTAPADSPDTEVEEVVLDWEPVAGAASYDLQISTDENFNTVEHSRLAVKGTRYSPPITLDNDQYFWRVRPVDTLGNQLAWTDVDAWAFRRHWPEQPELEHPRPPADGGAPPVVGDPFYYQWTPVEKASHYTVEISRTTDFTAREDACTTVHTTYVPVSNGDCYPAAAGTYFWRVVAYDAYDRATVVRTDAIKSQVGRFSYLPAMVDLRTASPANGATVEIPTLEWAPVAGAATYKVFITATDGGAGAVNGAVTASTTYTPRLPLTVGKSYRWWVQTISATGRPGPSLVPEAQSTFTAAASTAPRTDAPAQLTPEPGTQVGRLPGFTWQPVTGASYYKLGTRPSQSIEAFTELPDRFAYPAGDLTTARPFDRFDWIVNAYDASHTKIASSPYAWTIDLDPLPTTGGPQAAMTGTGTEDGHSCTAVLPARCQDLRQTPVLRWDPVEGAGGYQLYLSRDKEMTNLVTGFPVFVEAPMWMSAKALIDSQAGDAFYWEVQPCVTTTLCAPVQHAPWAFNKKANPIELVSPANGAEVADDVTFDWRDFLATNSDPTNPHAVDVTGEPARIGAMRYRLEVSTLPNFQTILDSVEVDQTTYTAFGRTYPEGQLYWRVSAIDGSNNVLTSSRSTPTEYHTFTKKSPTPVLSSPTPGSTVDQTEPFRWKPLDFAASYDIEVYRDGDMVGQLANRVIAGNSRQVAFTTTVPLPVSDTAYNWRVRRVDASGNKGAWTPLGVDTDGDGIVDSPAAPFRVTAAPPAPVAPVDDSHVEVVGGSDALFTWKPVADASAYRFERRLKGATSVSEVVTTPALAWAPTGTITDGSWQWRVSTLDAAGKITATSAWESFLVDGTSPTVTAKSPIGTVRPSTTFAARFSEPVKGVSTSTFRLFKKGDPDPVPSTVTLDAAGTQATLTARRRLARGATYTVKILPGISDRAGNPLAGTRWKVSVR